MPKFFQNTASDQLVLDPFKITRSVRANSKRMAVYDEDGERVFKPHDNEEAALGEVFMTTYLNLTRGGRIDGDGSPVQKPRKSSRAERKEIMPMRPIVVRRSARLAEKNKQRCKKKRVVRWLSTIGDNGKK
ncbi:hypothetical protein RUND412_007920 [Rhizina undulata]